MILYADTSALVKKYVRETGSDQVIAFFDTFEVIGTVALTQVEMASAMSKAVRQGWADESAMAAAWQTFLSHWPTHTRLTVTPAIMDRAISLAWQHGLRAYDALHLASALIWQEAVADQVTFACFDKRLLEAAQAEGLQIWPDGTD